MSDPLTHINERGEAHMVDVGGKEITKRIAVALGHIKMLPQTLEMITSGNAKKRRRNRHRSHSRNYGRKKNTRTHSLMPPHCV